MKRYLLAFLLTFVAICPLYAQNTPDKGYKWDEVDKLVSDQLYTKAYDLATQLFDKALKEKNSHHTLVGARYLADIGGHYREDNVDSSLQRYHMILPSLDKLDRAVCNMLLAEFYASYMYGNSWSLRNNMPSDSVDRNFRRWDIAYIESVAERHATAAFDDLALLQKTPADSLGKLSSVHSGNDMNITPTVYDVMMTRLFSIVGDMYINKLNVNDFPAVTNFFAVDKGFVSIPLPTGIDSSKSFALFLFGQLQEWERFHMKRHTGTDMMILLYKNRCGKHLPAIFTYFDNDSYVNSLGSAIRHYSTGAGSHITLLYYDMASKCHRMNQDKEALTYIDKAVSLYPKSPGAIQCSNLKNEILHKEVKVRMASVSPASRDILAVAETRNVDTLYYRVIKSFNYYGLTHSKMLEKLLGEKVLKEWSQPIDMRDDYRSQATYAVVPGMPQGDYFLLTSSEPGFKDSSFHLARFSVESLAILRGNEDGFQNGFVVDRITGKPVSGIEVTMFKQVNDKEKKITSVKTDKDGFYDFTPFINDNMRDENDRYGYYIFQVEYKGYVIRTDDGHVSADEEYNESAWRYDFFVDRPVYKPGDTVSFAFLSYTRDRRGEAAARSGIKVYCTLKDINYRVVDSVECLTDGYGMCNGRFVLPDNAIPGYWHLYASMDRTDTTLHSSTSETIKVESYKQPKFTVTLNNTHNANTFGETASFEGVAASYSAVPLSGATVSYTIKRERITPYWKWHYDIYNYGGKSIPEVVASGETKTDAQGFFRIDFIPMPDSNCNLTLRPSFRYSVSAVVTDINGESHSAASSLSVGFDNKYLAISGKSKGEGLNFMVGCHNLDGALIDGSFDITVSLLTQPSNPRLEHDMMSGSGVAMPISCSEFATRFPHYDCDGSVHDCTVWGVKRTLYHATGNSTDSKSFNVDLDKAPAGMYKVVARLKGDDSIMSEYYFLHEPPSSSAPVESDLLVHYCPAGTVHVGDTAHIRVGSRFGNVKLLVTVNGVRIGTSHYVRNISNEFISIDIPVTEAMLGGFIVNCAALYENHFECFSYNISVPYSHKELDITVESFRDKIEPGSRETWTVRVCNTQKQQPALANLMVTMYDKSLENYGYLSWYLYPFSSHYYSSTFRSIFSQCNHMTSFLKSVAYSRVYDYDYYYRILIRPNLRSYENNYGGRIYSTALRKTGRAKGESRVVENDGFVDYSDEPVVMAEMSMDVMEEEEVFLMVESDKKTGGDDDSEFMRQNLSTLAFFKPNLRTNADGEVEISFTAPDLLTQWSIKGLAWTKDMMHGTFNTSLVTQKPLMVVPNVPRFLRHGDTCYFSVKVSNMSGADQDVVVSLQMSDAVTGAEIPMVVGGTEKNIHLRSGNSGEVSFLLVVPQKDVYVANYKVIARGNGFSDGEQAPIPLLPNRQMVTESLAFYINGKGQKSFQMKHLVQLDTTAANFTLRHHSLTLDLTPNPIWLAMQSLPYVSQRENPSNIYLVNAVYSNSLSAKIVNDNPKIQQLFTNWEQNEPDAFLSALDRNSDLKQTVMEETPWLRNAMLEEQRHREIARFFDRKSIDKQLATDLNKLLDAQRSDGGWSWIPGDRESSLYTTQYIVKTFGLLRQLGVKLDSRTEKALNKAVDYIDKETYKYYERYIKGRGYDVVNLDYLYVRSYFPENKLSKRQKEAYNFFYNNARKYNKEYTGLYSQAVLGLVFNRHGDTKLAREMSVRIREKALYNDEMGMYWRDNTSGWLWSERPIETQALLIRNFAEVLGDYESIPLMQQWLLKQKQTTDWNTDVATVNAIQALLITKDNSSVAGMEPSSITVAYGDHILATDTSKGQLHVSQRHDADDIHPADGNVTVTKGDDGIAWGALYWQYFEQMDKIPSSSMGITLKRSLFRIGNDGKLTKVTPQTVLRVGDKVRVRLEIYCDRHLEYLELKDPRCAAMEPVNTSSGWNWNGGLSYYRAVTNTCQTLYINRLDKGNYTVEYDLYVNNAGTYVTAPTTMQCLYAPEFRALCPVPVLKVLPMQ